MSSHITSYTEAFRAARFRTHERFLARVTERMDAEGTRPGEGFIAFVAHVAFGGGGGVCSMC